jgi:hypothetical protein
MEVHSNAKINNPDRAGSRRIFSLHLFAGLYRLLEFTLHPRGF